MRSPSIGTRAASGRMRSRTSSSHTIRRAARLELNDVGVHTALDEPTAAFVVADADEHRREHARRVLDAGAARADEQVRVTGPFRGACAAPRPRAPVRPACPSASRLRNQRRERGVDPRRDLVGRPARVDDQPAALGRKRPVRGAHPRHGTRRRPVRTGRGRAGTRASATSSGRSSTTTDVGLEPAGRPRAQRLDLVDAEAARRHLGTPASTA